MCLPSIAEAVTSNGRARSWKGTSPQALRGAKGSSFSSSVILRISFYIVQQRWDKITEYVK